MPVDRKHMKIGVAALAASALVIGLSVGLTQKNKSTQQSSQLAASSGYRMSDCIYVETEVDTYYSKSGKGGKSRRLSSKLRGLGSTSEMYEEEATYGEDSADIEIEQEPGYYGKSEGSYGSKGGKSGSYGSKGGKSGDYTQVVGLVEFCINECDYFIEQNPCLTSGGKSGKGSYGSYGGYEGKSGKSGGYDTFESPCDGVYSYGGKSGKSGGEGYEGEGYEGKSGKSGGYGSYEGKSSKGKIYEQVCLTPEPIPPTPPSIDIPPPPAPSDDTCIISVVTIDGELVCSNGEYPTADGYGDMAFINFKTCCNTLLAEGVIAADEECPIVDECGVPVPTPVETYEPTAGGSTGSTPTVATEAVSDIVDMGPRL